MSNNQAGQEVENGRDREHLLCSEVKPTVALVAEAGAIAKRKAFVHFTGNHNVEERLKSKPGQDDERGFQRHPLPKRRDGIDAWEGGHGAVPFLRVAHEEQPVHGDGQPNNHHDGAGHPHELIVRRFRVLKLTHAATVDLGSVRESRNE